MSKEIETTQNRPTSVPRKVSLNREDSGYNSIMGTPADTPCVVQNGRKISRQEFPLEGIAEDNSDLDQVVTPGSCPTQHYLHQPPATHRQLQPQLSTPSEERSTHSAPQAYGGCLSVPSYHRTYSLEASYYGNGSKRRYVSEKAAEIISRFEKMRMDSNETVHTQSPSPVEEGILQSPVPEVSQPIQPARGRLQRQFSEFPLDESVLTVGQDGCYLEDRDYNIVREAGAGGSASCNLGNDKEKSTPFIIKRPKRSFTEEGKREMMRESRILQQINHENVIRFYGAVEDLEDHCFKIFLEYADETCGDIHYLFCESEDSENFSGNIALIMLYVQQMLFAVSYLHSAARILHLDIKGKNIVVCNGGYRVKLIDFGTACNVESAAPQNNGWTPVFAAPEINNQSQPPKFSADIWSLMCVAVEMVTGELPWPNETDHQTALFKIGNYEDDQITELVEYDNYWDKYSYYEEHHEMYQELVNMWKAVFIKDSSSRPSAKKLLSMKWMQEMELNGESILYGLVNGDDQCVEESMENDSVDIVVSQPPVDDYSSQVYLNNEDDLSRHSFSPPDHTSLYQSSSSHLQGQDYTHSPTESDGGPYYSRSRSFSGRPTAHSTEYFPSVGPSSLPTAGAYQPIVFNSAGYSYQNSSTPVVGSLAPFLMGELDSRDDGEYSCHTRSRSVSVHAKPVMSNSEQVTGKRRKSLCYIGTSKSEPTNVLNASGIMDKINKANVKRVNSLVYVSEGPKTDSPVNSPRMERPPESLTQASDTVATQPKRRHSSSDLGTPTQSFTSSNADSGYGQSFEEHFIRRSMSVGQSSLPPSRLSLPDREEHKPDGCSEPSETIPHTLQLSSPTGGKMQQIEVHGSMTVKELMKMTQNSRQTDRIVVKLGSSTVKT